jgi:two-component sensor histidine kinase
MQNEKKGEIKLKIFYDEGTLHLFIKDNGPGLPTNFGSSDSLGMVLINALTEQLSAEYSFTNNEGTEFLMKFENPIVEGITVT